MVFQSLGLVDGEDAYTSSLSRGYGTAGDTVLPCPEKLVDVLWIISQISLQLIHECQHICILPLDTFQMQQMVKPLGQ